MDIKLAIIMSDPTQEIAKILFSVSNAFALPIEKNFSPEVYLKFANDNWPIPIVLVTLYLLFCYYGSKYMSSLVVDKDSKQKERDPFDLIGPLAAWNAFLSLFSFIGMFRTVPFLVASILANPYEKTICMEPMAPGGALL